MNTRKKKARRSSGHPEPRLGIDIGRVIIAPPEVEGADTSFLGGTDESAMPTPPSDGAFEAIRRLVDLFEGRVWLVSKCGAKIQNRSRLWLHHWRFFDETGLKPENLRFCRQRPEKAIHCAKLGITHFVDDRVDVLRHLREGVPHLFLFGPQRKDVPEWSIWVRTWADTEREIRARFPVSAELSQGSG